MLQCICHDVAVKPTLLPLEGERLTYQCTNQMRTELMYAVEDSGGVDRLPPSPSLPLYLPLLFLPSPCSSLFPLSVSPVATCQCGLTLCVTMVLDT